MVKNITDKIQLLIPFRGGVLNGRHLVIVNRIETAYSYMLLLCTSVPNFIEIGSIVLL